MPAPISPRQAALAAYLMKMGQAPEGAVMTAQRMLPQQDPNAVLPTAAKRLAEGSSPAARPMRGYEYFTNEPEYTDAEREHTAREDWFLKGQPHMGREAAKAWVDYYTIPNEPGQKVFTPKQKVAFDKAKALEDAALRQYAAAHSRLQGYESQTGRTEMAPRPPYKRGFRLEAPGATHTRDYRDSQLVREGPFRGGGYQYIPRLNAAYPQPGYEMVNVAPGVVESQWSKK